MRFHHILNSYSNGICSISNVTMWIPDDISSVSPHPDLTHLHISISDSHGWLCQIKLLGALKTQNHAVHKDSCRSPPTWICCESLTNCPTVSSQFWREGREWFFVTPHTLIWKKTLKGWTLLIIIQKYPKTFRTHQQTKTSLNCCCFKVSLYIFFKFEMDWNMIEVSKENFLFGFPWLATAVPYIRHHSR